MRVVLFGGTGMVGAGVLIECLDDPRVESVTSIVRRTTDTKHPKLREIVHTDFYEYSSLRSTFADADVCFFCLGVSVVGLREDQYYHLTYDLTLAAAHAMVAVRPELTFCYVSGAHTDSTEQGRVMWARIKGKTENALLALPFRAAYMFRPGYIQPLRGVRSKTALYQAIYRIISPFYPLLRRLFPKSVTTSVNVGRAMIAVAANGYPRRIVESDEINVVAGAA